MSLFQSLTVGVAGLQSQASKLGVISDNVANVNTVGYKAGVASFNTLVTDFSSNFYNAGGVQPGHQQTNQKTGLITATGGATDLAISGRGFFPVSDSSSSGSLFYTRVGTFSKNSGGDYMNSNGYFLQGWRLDVNGDLPATLTGNSIAQGVAETSLETVNVDKLSVAPIATSFLTLRANLKSSETSLVNDSISYAGNLSSTQTAVPTVTLDVATSLRSTDTIYGSFDFQVAQLFDQLQSLNATDRQAVSTSISNLFPGATLPSRLLIDQSALQSFISAQYGSGATSVQTFLSAVQPSLSAVNPFKIYQSNPIAYDALSASANMTSNTVVPNYKKSLDIYDSAGVKRAISVSYLKTADHSWAVEVYADQPGEMTTLAGSPPGLIASGNVTFASDGKLATISPSLTTPVDIDWNTPTTTSTLSFDFGTVGSATGLSESTNAYSAILHAQPTYNPAVAASSMSTGAITPHYTRTATVVGNDGVARDVTLNFLKTADNTWAVEVTAQPPASLTTPVGAVPGQIAYGTVTFNGDDTFANRVGNLVNAVFSTSQSTTQKEEARQAINTVLGSTLITVPDLDNPTTIKSKLINALQVPPYPVAPDALEQFVASVQAPLIGLPITNPLKTYQVPLGTNGALASVSTSLTNPITLNWATATEANTIQFNWGMLGQKNGLKQISTAFTGTPTATLSYSPIDATKNMTSGAVTPNFTRSIDVVDKGGSLRTLNFNFLKTGTNTWAVEIAAKKASDVALPTAQIAHGVVTFNGDGTLASITPSLSDPLVIDWSTGGPSTIQLDLGTAGPIAGTANAPVIGLADGLRQVNSTYEVNSVHQNGSIAGEHATISIDQDGYLIGTYENGSVRRLYKLPLAEFVSPDKLAAISNNVFSQTSNAGAVTYFQAGLAQGSSIESGALETSNVDLSNELSNMMIAQRSYQSNSKLITTTDSLLDVLTKM